MLASLTITSGNINQSFDTRAQNELMYIFCASVIIATKPAYGNKTRKYVNPHFRTDGRFKCSLFFAM